MSTEIEFAGPGELMVEIIKHAGQQAATYAVTEVLQAIFAGERSIEDVLLAINDRGMEAKFYFVVEIPGAVMDDRIIDVPVQLGVASGEVKMPPGQLIPEEVH